MSGTQAEGTIRNVAGAAEEAIGSMTGDSTAEMRGKVRQVAGQAQSAMGDAVETVRHMAADQPVMTVLLAAGIGLIAGMLIARR
ncbi:MAG: CsbD family protein [Rhodospirillales bacterium]|nr:CsbD family protein [Rhodospirillales bacterium]